MRLIDADALEQAYDDKYILGDCGRRERDDVVDALRYAPTIAAPRWVRCKDAVPEPHKNALFCGKKGGMFVGWTYGYGEDGVFRAFVHGGNARTVTHWMPLPEPPKEENIEP